MLDERWRPASEPPECEANDYAEGVRCIAEHTNSNGDNYTCEAWFVAGTFYDAADYPDYNCESIKDVTRWRYWPEPPMPEQEERAKLERVMLIRMSRTVLALMETHNFDFTEKAESFVREWATKDPHEHIWAKGGDA